MECPKCNLVNPPTALRCDCGYDFQTRTIEESYLTGRDKQSSRQGAGIAGVVLAILFALEFLLRLTNVAVAKHSVLLGVLTLVLVTICFGAWLWLLNRKSSSKPS